MVFGNKKIFKNKEGEIHVGNSSPKGYSECKIEDIKEILVRLKDKKIWRCHICNDLHIGKSFPQTCPTCFQIDAYIEINEKELKSFLQI